MLMTPDMLFSLNFVLRAHIPRLDGLKGKPFPCPLEVARSNPSGALVSLMAGWKHDRMSAECQNYRRRVSGGIAPASRQIEGKNRG